MSTTLAATIQIARQNTSIVTDVFGLLEETYPIGSADAFSPVESYTPSYPLVRL